PAARRAVARPRADRRAADLPAPLGAARRGDDAPARRAERPPGARDRRPRVRDGGGAVRGLRHRAGAARVGGDRAGLPRDRRLDLQEAVQQLINALSLGSTYALLALGLAMVFSILGLINFAHGELVTIGGYTMWTLFNHGFPWPAVLLLTLIATTLAAVAMERIAFRPLRGANIATLLITS